MQEIAGAAEEIVKARSGKRRDYLGTRRIGLARAQERAGMERPAAADECNLRGRLRRCDAGRFCVRCHARHRRRRSVAPGGGLRRCELRGASAWQDRTCDGASAAAADRNPATKLVRFLEAADEDAAARIARRRINSRRPRSQESIARHYRERFGGEPARAIFSPSISRPLSCRV